jgi:DNA-binding GntR family transcriptional regulator
MSTDGIHVGMKKQHGMSTRSPEGAQTLAGEIHTVLKKDIMDLHLKPGTILQEAELAKRFGVSRTPVREALQRLAAQGLVTITPQRGAAVSDVSIQDVLGAYQIRELLEPHACRIAAERISDEDLERIQRLADYESSPRPKREDLARYVATDSEIHDIILAAAGNPLLRQVVKDMTALTTRVQFIIPDHRPKANREELLKIVEALLRRDPIDAETAMREHLIKAKERLTQ